MTDRIRRNAPHVARVLLGLIFFVFGLNGFLGFIPQPPIDGPAATFIGGFFSASYMLPLLKGTEVIAGAALLSNRFVPLSLTVLAPIVLNIVAFHVFLAPTGLGVTFLGGLPGALGVLLRVEVGLGLLDGRLDLLGGRGASGQRRDGDHAGDRQGQGQFREQSLH